MNDRTPEQILVEWRACEALFDPEAPEPELLHRIDQLRSEHRDALAAREQEARELARSPGATLDIS